MSKERLEEIKEDVFKCNHGDTRGYSYEQLYHIALSLVRIHGKWLIEQAERAKKYEHDLKNMNMQLKGARRLNTRYREALKEIASKRMTYADMFGAIRTAKEALRDKE